MKAERFENYFYARGKVTNLVANQTDFLKTQQHFIEHFMNC